jgi:hypothetical protein
VQCAPQATIQGHSEWCRGGQEWLAAMASAC